MMRSLNFSLTVSLCGFLSRKHSACLCGQRGMVVVVFSMACLSQRLCATRMFLEAESLSERVSGWSSILDTQYVYFRLPSVYMWWILRVSTWPSLAALTVCARRLVRSRPVGDFKDLGMHSEVIEKCCAG
mmetsp:Transcript_4668/g.13045  ORF Transcript_4668/g.13045 Transcript_4668/m.13045 type:complete len:130 (-) Transcript_4668:89-478(-)